MLNELKLKDPNIEFGKHEEIEYLKAKHETLKLKYQYLLNEVSNIKVSESYILITKIKDWNEYFEIQKKNLLKEYEELNHKFVSHEK